MSRDDLPTIDPGDVDALLAAADPLPAVQARALPVGEAQDVLCQALLVHLRGSAAAVDAAAPTVADAADAAAPARPRRPRRRLVTRLALAVAVVFGLSMAALSLGTSGDEPGTVWAAELVRLAQASPLVLLDAPGWQVSYADEQSAAVGELHFSLGPPPTASRTPVSVTEPTDVSNASAQLNWRPGRLSMWTRDRAASASVSTTAPVLGTTAHVYQYDGGRPGHQDVTALWRYDGRVLEFRAGVADVAAFEVLLAALQRVDTDTWLSAMPDSVVKTSDRSKVIAAMLRGVALPPGFDPASIKGSTLTKDRYQLGAAVTGTVACTWFKRWSDAGKRGDHAGVREAIAAMATAKEWPILDEMSKSGAYPEVLEQFAAAMRDGRWYGRPLEGDVDSGLGCPSLGIPLS